MGLAIGFFRQLGEQVGDQPVGGVVQGQLVDLLQVPVHALAHHGHQALAGLERLLRQAHEGGVGEGQQPAVAQGIGIDGIGVAGHEHDRLGKGPSRLDDFDHLLVAFLRQPVELDAALQQQIETFRFLALLEQHGAFVQPDLDGGGGDTLDLGVVEGREQKGLAQGGDDVVAEHGAPSRLGSGPIL